MQRQVRTLGERADMSITEADKHTASIRSMGELVTVKQVAECAQISLGTVYNLVKDGKLKAVRVRGNMIRLNRDDVCAYFGL